MSGASGCVLFLQAVHLVYSWPCPLSDANRCLTKKEYQEVGTKSARLSFWGMFWPQWTG